MIDLPSAARFFGFSVDPDYGTIQLSESTTTTDEFAARGYLRSTLLSASGRRCEHKRLTRKGRPVARDDVRAWSVWTGRSWLARRDRKLFAMGGGR